MHRVLNLVSVCLADTTTLKEDIRNKLTTYNLHEHQVNDGINEEGESTLAINADFNSATDANEFHDWLKTYIMQNKTSFKNARTRVHDCFHAEGQTLPCQIGDIGELI